MSLSVKDPETDRLARALAAETDETITVALRTAVHERLARIRSTSARSKNIDSLRQIIERGRKRPILNTASESEILGYDNTGLFQ